VRVDGEAHANAVASLVCAYLRVDANLVHEGCVGVAQRVERRPVKAVRLLVSCPS
jgi:hypothetical protein